MQSAELLLHPVRLRIVQQFLGNQQLTAGALRERLPEVSSATIYRQVGLLVEHDVLEVVEERQARGAVERTYALRSDRASVSPDELAAMTPQEHLAAFTGFVSTLLADFERYVEGPRPHLLRDLVGYRQVAFHASDEELMEVLTQINAAVLPLLAAEPAPGRRRRVLSTVLLPTEPPAQDR